MLCIATNVTAPAFVSLSLCECVQVGPHICLFKTHVDIFDNWDASVAEKLRQIADKHSMSPYHLSNTVYHALPILASPANAMHDICRNAPPQALCSTAHLVLIMFPACYPASNF